MLQALSNLLFAGYRRRVLALLLLHPERQSHVREIARLTGTAAGTLHKELSRLAQAGILLRTEQGKQVYYTANRECPVFEELASILRKTAGLSDVIAQRLAPVAEKLRVAVIFGSVARGTERASSDVDVLLVGNISFAEAVRLLHPAQAVIGREINPKVYNPKEWQAKLQAGSAFVREIVAKPKIFLIGNHHDLAKPLGH
jgi:predicted nucleotidyltransferase